MAHFRATTTGHTVIMGRNTYESIPREFRPLKNRNNIVISRDDDFANKATLEGASVVKTIDEAVELAKYICTVNEMNKKTFVIGGSSIYEQLLPYCTSALVTRISGDYDCNKFLPETGGTLIEKIVLGENTCVEHYDLTRRDI